MSAAVVPFEGAPVVEHKWDKQRAERHLREWASSDGSGEKATVNWSKYAKGFAFVHHEAGRKYPQDFGAYSLPHHDVIDGRMVTVKAGVEHAAARIDQVGGMTEPDRKGVRRHLAAHYRQWNGTPPWNKAHDPSGAANASASQPAPAPEDDDMTPEQEEKLNACHAMLTQHGGFHATTHGKLDELKADMDGDDGDMGALALPPEIAAIVGGDKAQAVATLTGWKAAFDEIGGMKTAFDALKAAEHERDVKLYVDGLLRPTAGAPKITPGQVDNLVALGKRDFPALKAFGDALSPLAQLVPATPAAESDAAVLTTEMMAMAKKFGNDPAQVAAHAVTLSLVQTAP